MTSVWDERHRENEAALCACLGSNYTLVTDDTGGTNCRHYLYTQYNVRSSDFVSEEDGAGGYKSHKGYHLLTCDDLHRCARYFAFDDAAFFKDMD
eukprot:gene2742-15022_t